MRQQTKREKTNKLRTPSYLKSLKKTCISLSEVASILYTMSIRFRLDLRRLKQAHINILCNMNN